MKYAVCLVCVLIAGLWAVDSGAQQNNYQVIVHPSHQDTSIAKTELKRVFLKQRTKWSTGDRAFPADLKSPEVRAAFYQDVANKRLAAVDSYWQGQVFAAKSSPPKMLAADRDVVDYVRATRGAVGYVSTGAKIDGTKVVTVVD